MRVRLLFVLSIRRSTMHVTKSKCTTTAGIHGKVVVK